MEQSYKLNNKMYFLLVEKSIDHFTVHELRVAYWQAGFSSNNSNKDRQFLYRQLFMLEEKGLLVKKGNEYSRDIRYSKTKAFLTGQVFPINPEKLRQHFPDKPKALPDLQQLKLQLNEYQVKFVSTLGQTEEYHRLFSQFPALRDQFKKDYHQTRDDSNRYLGRIQALRKVIAAQDELKSIL